MHIVFGAMILCAVFFEEHGVDIFVQCIYLITL